MGVHDYNFEGGDKLSKIGAGWFVSYCYYFKIKREHKNWDRVSTAKSRISNFKNSTQYHKYWLGQVLLMNNLKLKNSFGVSAENIKLMAKELLGLNDF